VYKIRTDQYAGVDISDLVSEKRKNKPPYLIAMGDELISQLVGHRRNIRRMRNLYEGVRDPAMHKYLTDNKGIGNPSSVPFIPLLRNRVEVLKGKYLDAGIPHKVGMSDSYSLGLHAQEKHEALMMEFARRLTADLPERAQAAAEGQTPPPPQMLRETELQNLEQQMAKFQSSLEKQAARVLRELLAHPELRLRSHFEKHLENLLVDGQTYYRTEPAESGLLPKHRPIGAGELYHNAPRGDKNLDNATAFVWRRLMHRQHVLREFGHQIDADEKRMILGVAAQNSSWQALPMGGEKYLDLYATNVNVPEAYKQWLQEIDGTSNDLVEVFYVEWIACNKVDLTKAEQLPPGVPNATGTDGRPIVTIRRGPNAALLNDEAPEQEKKDIRYREDLYHLIRIGDNIYPSMGQIDEPIRWANEPWRVRPFFRGASLDKSLIAMCEDLQNDSDIMHYHAKSIVAKSGTTGMLLPINDIPVELGNNPIERLLMAQAYRRNGGVVPINPMQPGGTKGQFSNYQSYDDTLKGNVLDGIQKMLQFYDDLASSITGVNRQMLGGISERDGKAVTEQAVVGATLITRPIFEVFDNLIGEALADMLNMARKSFKRAIGDADKPTLVLGQAGRDVFTIDAEKYSLAHYSVFIEDGRKQSDQLKTLTQMGIEFAKGQLLPAEHAVRLVFAQDLGEEKDAMISAIQKQRTSNIATLEQKIQQLEQQVAQNEKDLGANKQAELQAQQAELALRGKEVAIEQQRANTEGSQGEQELGIKREELAMERDQAINNPPANSAEIKNQR
jgi:hypothetical protein